MTGDGYERHCLVSILPGEQYVLEPNAMAAKGEEWGTSAGEL